MQTLRFQRAVRLALWLPVLAAPAIEIKPSDQEQQAAHLWLRQHWLECELKPSSAPPPPPPPAPPAPGLEVLANNDAVIPNGRGSHPLKIGDKEYSRGLYCHAVSQVEVRLPSPGKSFTAVVGLDHNEDTARGKGSVVFKVMVKDQVAFQSEVMRFGTPARTVSVDLGGAEVFTLAVGDAGDGIGWDQSDWAEAKVTLADGRELWLGDLPLRDRRSEAAPAPIARASILPLSFVYGGQSSDALLAAWPRKSATNVLDAFRTGHTLTWTDGQTGLEVRAVALAYRDFPVTEWTIYFKNTGRADTPVLENLQALDMKLERDAAGEFVLHGNKGDWCAPQSYEPYQLTLGPQTSHRFAPDGGRPTNGPKGWPYFNVQRPGGGLIFAIGWPGQWACSFTRDDRNGLRIVAGQEGARLYLKPGEEIRTPLMATLFWQGADTVRAQNLWRRWFMAHNLPRVNGQPPAPMMQMQCYRTFEKGGEQDLFDTVAAFNQMGIAVELCWRDAGWYPCKGSWPNTGTWEIDPQRYPNGFRPFSDWLHQQGKKFIVWFEPERVGDRGSWLATQHPDWLLGGTLLNLGHPEAWQWLVERIDTLLREQGIDYYRQDFNMDPLSHWRAADAPNRRGLTEIKHVMGYLAFWDELRRRHPGLLIDSCASGGRRNDLETLRRAVPLLRSDYQFGHEATLPNQGHTYGISSWIPYYGSGCYFTDPYSARSYIMPCSGYAGTTAETKRAYDECRQVAPFMLGDYYPLTPYSLKPGDWIAWQFDRPDRKGGVVQAFRRDKNEAPSQRFRLAGLDPAVKYKITDVDGGMPRTMTGQELMDEGLAVEIKAKPGAAVIFYQAAKSARAAEGAVPADRQIPPAATLRAGLARIDITPTRPVMMAGYGSRTNLSQGVHDPLSARAVAFEQAGKRLVLVSLDNLGFYNDTAQPLRQAILDACQLQPSELFLCAIHTHSAPTLTLAAEKAHANNVAYTKALQGKLVEVARQALKNLTPVDMGVGSGFSPVGANRREAVSGDAAKPRIVLGRNPAAATDREVQVLKLLRAGENEGSLSPWERAGVRGLLGVVFAYATHSTSLGPRNYLVSGDVHGLAEQFLETHLGAGVVAPALAGASGNIDPWYRVLPGFNTTNGWVPEPVLLGTLLGEEVAHVLRKIQPSFTNVAIRTALQTFELPGKARGEAAPTAADRPSPFVVTVGCVGDLALVGLGGEVFNEIGQAIKAASPFPSTLVFTHCNAAGGYLPTRPSYAEGGYEVQSSPFAPGAAERLVEETTRMLKELRAGRN